MMRLQQAIAFGGSEGYLTAHHYDQIFTAHGVIMIFFVAMPLVTGLMNLRRAAADRRARRGLPVPQQLQLLDDAAGACSSWSRCSSASSPDRVAGVSAASGSEYSPDVGVDYYIWSLQVAGSAHCSPA
jgi:cytochrome o ubiquinol oxidase subunit 1